MRYVLGIDAGGTHTRCQIADEKGLIISAGHGGPANTNFISPRGARRSVARALSEALKSFNRSLEATVFAGPHLPVLMMRDIPLEIRIKKRVFVSEFEATLAAGLQKPRGSGVVILSGTGSFCRGRDPAGREKCVGGWGPTIGDEGSAYDLAREALAAIVKSSDGRGEQTILTDLISSRLKLSQIDDLKGWLYHPPIKRHIFAGLAEYVFAAAEANDHVAKDILRAGGMRLTQLALPVLTALFGEKESFPVVLSGGVLKSPSIVTQTLMTVIKKARPRADVFISSFQPVVGAVIIGLDSIGVEITPSVIMNMGESVTKWRGE